ncbi:MAG TPA: YadA-like family protein [Caulobacteraceae bacterium]|nr:YadA-like family protein [Caulobacteraceae bacterium]
MTNVSTSLTAVSTSVSALSTSVDNRFAMLGVGPPGSQGTPSLQNLALGVGSSAGVGGTAVGFNASAGNDSVALGTNAFAKGPGDTALGFGAQVNATNGTAVGTGATINAVGGTAIGANATVAAGATNAVAIGEGSTASAPNTVSFGGPGVGTRRLTNVSPGVNGTDAANFSQVRRAYSGIAMAFAQTAVQPSLATGEQSLTGGAGVFQDQWGFALKYEARPADKWFVGAAISVGDNDWGGSAGVGFKW